MLYIIGIMISQGKPRKLHGIEKLFYAHCHKNLHMLDCFSLTLSELLVRNVSQ